MSFWDFVDAHTVWCLVALAGILLALDSIVVNTLRHRQIMAEFRLRATLRKTAPPFIGATMSSFGYGRTIDQ